ncbi:phage protein NinX family protein [Citrobacter freundii]|uniref:phage protein NinX family protein n=1 Tax=Citrobacter freundii TaxID=546 RepID=UPI00292A68C1|nr:phage protein NinX family protein [Citrobacter freundii]MEB0335704.1 phage protein NinX family protein [Citrobacter freundii]HED6952351.1 DUF2591 family protein [Citrobacter freundii]
MDYSKLSDFEINSAVSMALLDKSANPSARYVAIGDYCNNPADAWPILLENHIAVVPYRHTLPQAWPTAFGMASKFMTEHANPLRAGMIVFLMMQESANVPANSTGSDIR